MKKLILTALLACGAVLAMQRSFAAEAKITKVKPATREGALTEWTPLAITIVGPVGLPWGFWNVKGLQIGLWNDVDEFSGLQIGGVNCADRAYGIQIGFLNFITGDDCPFLPVVNWSF